MFATGIASYTYCCLRRTMLYKSGIYQAMQAGVHGWRHGGVARVMRSMCRYYVRVHNYIQCVGLVWIVDVDVDAG
jgi:hypothetical protein